MQPALEGAERDLVEPTPTSDEAGPKGGERDDGRTQDPEGERGTRDEERRGTRDEERRGGPEVGREGRGAEMDEGHRR